MFTMYSVSKKESVKETSAVTLKTHKIAAEFFCRDR